ncbi:PAAR-like protein [Chryseobacterium sp.]|uniref:PAAR-like protein n=1 Tax=Chryseobacterium sp. TaxID=1871047 RepID=UPI00388E84FA
MKTYLTKPGDTFEKVAKNFGIKNADFLKTHHNLNCDSKDIVKDELPEGLQIAIPDDPQFLDKEQSAPNDEKFIIEGEDFEFGDEGVDTISESEDSDEETGQNSKNEDKKEEKQKESSSSEHDGKFFVIQKGMCQCNQGFKFPKFKVTSHQKHYWNDADGQFDFLAVTEDDLTLDPVATPFGQCKLKPTPGGYQPCAYAPSGKWTKTYEKVKVMGKSCVTEISELMCTTGGKITILKHGQQSEAGKSNATKADSTEQNTYNPIVNYDEFKEEVDSENQTYYS